MSRYAPVKIWRGRTMTLRLELGVDVSGDTLTSIIRAGKDSSTAALAEWDVAFESDGTDGVVILTLDDSVTSAISVSKGYMDIKRVSGGEPLHVFDDILRVVIKGAVT